MQEMNTIWFNNYDAKPCLLYRSAMALRSDSWKYVDDPSNAQWWVVYTPNTESQDRIISLSRQQTVMPIIVFIKDNDIAHSEYHVSQAILKLPFNYVSLFKWIDGVSAKLADGSLFKNLNNESSSQNAKVFNQQRWYDEPFRLKQWPNVARFGSDVDIVIYCATMIQDFYTRKELLSMGMDPQQFISLMCNAERYNMIIYQDRRAQDKIKPKSHDLSANSNNSLNLDSEESAITFEQKENTENPLEHLLNKLLNLQD